MNKIKVLLVFFLVFLVILSVTAFAQVKSSDSLNPSKKQELINAAYKHKKIDKALVKQYETSDFVKAVVNVRVSGRVPSNMRIVESVRKNTKMIEDFGAKKDAFAAILTIDEVLKLAGNSYVYFIEDVEIYYPALEDVVNITNAEDAWEETIFDIGLDGTGQTICIVDTGIDFTHPDLEDKDIVGGNLVCPDDLFSDCELDIDVEDTLGHGTFVSGIAAANGGKNGVARGADLIALKVFNDATGVTDSIRVRNAIDWCIANQEKHDISVILLSVASGTLYEDNCDRFSGFMTYAINIAVDENIAVAAAAGNNGNNTAIASPACIENVISVGSTTKKDELAVNSNYNDLVKLFAPGVEISSTCIEGDEGEVDGYCTKSGTSVAAPAVAGALAIMQQVLALSNESLSVNPLDLEDILFNTGDPITDLDEKNWRRINVLDAVLEIKPHEPVLNPIGDYEVVELDSLTIDLEASDEDVDDILTFYTDATSMLPIGSEFAFNTTTGIFEWTPELNDAGIYEVIFGVTDGLFEVEETITIIVEDAVVFIRGETNNVPGISLSDVFAILDNLYDAGDNFEITCNDAADVNDDGKIDLADSVYLSDYLFANGPEPPEPFNQEGIDPTADSLGCAI